MEKLGLSLILAAMLLTIPFISESQAKPSDQLVNMEEENTLQHAKIDQEDIKPNQHVEEMLQNNDIKIENDVLLKLLNESNWNTSPFAFGYQANISLGRWPLHYRSDETTVHPHFQPINKNEKENSSDSKTIDVYYHQLEEKRIKGALTKKVDNADQIKKMILRKAMEQQELPIAFQVSIGKDTVLSKTYQVPPSDEGVLTAYLPAVKESGYITMGEVFLKMKGSTTELLIKNVTEQEVGAFLPIVNHLSFTFETE